MKRYIFVCVVAIWAMGFSPRPGFPGAPQPVLTLQQCIRLGLKRNLNLQAARYSIVRAAYLARAARADFFPKFKVNGTYRWIDHPVTIDIPAIAIHTPLGPLTSPPTTVTKAARNSAVMTTSLVQPLFTGGALTERYHLSKLEEQSEENAYENNRQTLIEAIKNAYFDLLKAQKIQVLMVRFVRQLTDHLKTAKAFLDEKIIPLNDYLQTKVTLSNANLNLIKAENGHKIAQSALNLLLNRNLNTPVRAVLNTRLHPLTHPLNYFQDIALSSRPDLKVALAKVKEARSLVRLAKSRFYPQVAMSVNYRDLSDESLENDSASVLFTANWSIFEWNKRKWEVDAQKARLEQAILMESQLKQLILQQVKTAYLDVRQSYRRIQTIQEAVHQAKENLRINNERYKEQVATSTDVIDAQTLLLRTEVNLTVARIDYLSALARLEKAVGKSLAEDRM